MDSTMYFCSGLDRWSNFILVEAVISTSWGSCVGWYDGVAGGDLSLSCFCVGVFWFLASSVGAWPSRNEAMANSSATTETAAARDTVEVILRFELFVQAKEGVNAV